MKICKTLLFGVLIFGGLSTLQASPLQSLKLALNWKPEPQFGGFYAGVEQKIFEKHGFQLSIVPGGAGTPVPQLLESNNVDLGIVTGDEVVIGRARGLTLKAFFAVYQNFPQGIMLHASRKIDSFEELFGRPGELALQKGVPYALFLEKKYGNNSKVKIVPYVGGIGLFEKNKEYSQQCFINSEPLVAQKKGISVNVLPVSASGYNPYATVLVAKEAWLEKNKAALPRLYAALQESWESYLKDPSATNKTMHKLNPTMDEETLTKSAAAQKPLIVVDEGKGRLGVMKRERWALLAEQLKDLKIVPRIEANPDNYFVSTGK